MSTESFRNIEILTLRRAAAMLKRRGQGLQEVAARQVSDHSKTQYGREARAALNCASIVDDVANMIERDDAPGEWRDISELVK